ncbi:Galactose-specific lectin nattectin [Holothuria leucospilota]|uniref:Galactose-specific lectin nattectin n=1 Tax=Holothuria leucospilota TaxID=206669 RepID=A0A9Q1BBB2_HOLLE|nr:Galactose-specific lectin nattectin [Holothuria leucospilota]
MLFRFLLLLMFLNLRIVCDGRALDSRSFVRGKSWRSTRILPEIYYSAEGNLQNFIVQGCPDDFRVVLEPGETEIAVTWDEDGFEEEVRIYTGSDEFSSHITTKIDTIYRDLGYGNDLQCNFRVTVEGQPQVYESNYYEDSGGNWESWESNSDLNDGAIDVDNGWNWQTVTTEIDASTDAQMISTTDQSPAATGQVTRSNFETGSVWLGQTSELLHQSSTHLVSIYGETKDEGGNDLGSTLPHSDQGTDETRTTSYGKIIEFTENPVTGKLKDVVSGDESVTSMAPSTLQPVEATSQDAFYDMNESYEFTTQRPTTESRFVSTDIQRDSTSPVTPPQTIGTYQVDLSTMSSYETIFDGTSRPTTDILEKSSTENSKYFYSQEDITMIPTDSLNATAWTLYDTEEVVTTENNVTDITRNAKALVWVDDVTQPSVSTGLYESQTPTCRLPDGRFIQVGEYAVTLDCGFVCLCDETKSLLCVRKGCRKFEKCEQQNKKIGCFCQTGFTFDGQECIKDCPRAFLPFEDSCYYFHNKRMGFEEAEKFCLKMEANLASIHNERENEFISSLVGVKKEVWIGAFRSTEEPFEFITNGNLQRPQFISTEIPAGLYRIEFSIDPVSNAHIFLGPEPEVVMSMYEIVLGSTGEFNLAIRRCPNCTNRISSFRSELIHNSTQGERFYLTFKNNMIEIGKVGAYVPLVSYVDMSGDPHEVRFIGFASRGATVKWKLFSDFNWSDGSPWWYENWYLTEPDLFPVDDVMSCVFLNYKFNPSWNDDNCEHKRRFVCKQ